MVAYICCVPLAKLGLHFTSKSYPLVKLIEVSRETRRETEHRSITRKIKPRMSKLPFLSFMLIMFWLSSHMEEEGLRNDYLQTGAEITQTRRSAKY